MQAHRIRRLPKKQSDELALGRSSPDMLFSVMSNHELLKRRPGNMVQKIKEYAVLAPHGVALFSCPRTFHTLGYE
jgi:hypothetical protein